MDQTMTQLTSINSAMRLQLQNISPPLTYIYDNVQGNSVNFINNERFVDQQFSLQASGRKVVRLCQMFPLNSSIFTDLHTGRRLARPTKNAINLQNPSFLSQLNMLPFSHYFNLIEPKFINDQGFYYVMVVKNGMITRQIIDDKFFLDQQTGKIVTLPLLEDCIWVHIIMKAWAKINKGFQNMIKSPPFSFIQTFSFPDWQIINPSKQKKQVLIHKLKQATKKNELMIAQTKMNTNVSYFGFTSNCASFIITGHFQQYGDIYIKIASYVNSRWNKVSSSQQTKIPEETPVLKQNEFVMPFSQFLNIFHLVYATSNKYHLNQVSQKIQSILLPNPCQHDSTARPPLMKKPEMVHYNKFQMPINAKSSNAVLVQLEVEPQSKSIGLHHHNTIQYYEEVEVGLSIYFPNTKVYNLVNNQHLGKDKNQEVVPWCKLILGSVLDISELDASYLANVKQKMLYCQQQTLQFVTHNRTHEYIIGDYFKGYSNYLTFHLYMKPGKYQLRLKPQQMLSQYRILINTTTINGFTRMKDLKAKPVEQATLLKDCLFKKAAHDKKFVTFVNPAKRGSWISCRDQFDNLGYSYIAVHVIKKNDNNIIINISPSKIREQGYIIKGHQHKDFNDYSIKVNSDQNTIIIFKHDEQWNGKQKRVWPPMGIQFIKVPRIQH